MEVRKLYYTDSCQKIFTGEVLACREAKAGWEVILDATAFYPEGGGQPCDTGSLGDRQVLKVWEDGDTVVHLCDGPLPVGDSVQGVIDWERRLDLMQQHTGEHMVSGVIHRLYGYHNVGFHMGADVITIDFDGPIAPEALPQIENAVNTAVWENLPINCFVPTEEALPRYPYRRKKDLAWPVRLVEIPGIDLCACCGTHLPYTGGVGLVKLFSCVKFHEGVRIEMACGGRALKILSDAYAQNRLVSQAFSATIQQTGLAAQRMNETLAGEKLRCANFQKRLFGALAGTYENAPYALHFEEDLTPTENRMLCDSLAAHCPIAITLAGTDKNGYSLCIISRTQDAKALGQQAVSSLNGRGGGKREAFQGSVCATRQEITDFFQSALLNKNNL